MRAHGMPSAAVTVSPRQPRPFTHWPTPCTAQRRRLVLLEAAAGPSPEELEKMMSDPAVRYTIVKASKIAVYAMNS